MMRWLAILPLGVVGGALRAPPAWVDVAASGSEDEMRPALTADGPSARETSRLLDAERTR